MSPIAAHAVPISGGPGVVSPTDDINFSEIALGNFALLTNQYSGLGVQFSGVWYNGCTECVVASPDGAHPDIANFNNNDVFGFTSATTILFANNVTDVSFAFASNGGTFGLQSFLDGALVESFNFNGVVWQTYGFSSSLFDEIRLSTPSAMIFDNLGFNSVPVSVPEPTMLSLLGAGLLGAALVRRRRRSAQ